MPNIPPSPMDMATLYAVKNWLGIMNNAQDANLQACITAASIYFLRMTGRGPANWQNATQNPFNEPVDYFETYDGNTGQKMFLRNFPINTVASLSVAGYSIPQSAGEQSPGYGIDNSGRAIFVRGSGYGYSGIGGVSGFGNVRGRGGFGSSRPFAAGPQTVQVQYNAGFTTIAYTDVIDTVVQGWQASTAVTAGEQISDGTFLQTALNSGTTGTVAPPWSATIGQQTLDGTVPTQVTWVNTGIAAQPYTIAIQSDAMILSDQGVSYFETGMPLEQVMVSPTVGQYFLVSPGNYLFSATDQGVEMLVNYTVAGTPADIILAIIQLVSLNYVRRNWIGIRSLAMKDVGSTSYTMQIDPAIQQVISNYTRAALNG